MPWCPKCKTEYIRGISQCVDCHIPLVDALETEAVSGNKQLSSKENKTRNSVCPWRRIRL